MNIQEFLAGCAMRGIHIMVDGDSISVESSQPIKHATGDFIKKNRNEIINLLTEDQQHGTCIGCGVDTESMLTTPYQSWCWCCIDCFDQRHAAHSQNATAAIL